MPRKAKKIPKPRIPPKDVRYRRALSNWHPEVIQTYVELGVPINVRSIVHDI